MSASLRVRPIERGLGGQRDRQGIAAVLAETHEFTPDEITVALELVDASIAETDDYRVLVCERGGDLDGGLERTLAGYVCFGPTPMTEGTFDLYWIATAPEARRAGVGRALLGALESELRAENARLVRVETSSRTHYDATRRFYDRVGFVVGATLHDFYAAGDHLVIYLRRLDRAPVAR